MRSSGVWCGLGLVVLLTSPMAAQVSNANDGVVPGARVRFSAIDFQSPDTRASRRMIIKGTVLAAPADSLVILFGGVSELHVRRSAITNLAVSRGTEVGWRAHPSRTAFETTLTLAHIAIFAKVMQNRGDAASALPRLLMGPALGASATLLTVTTAKRAFGRTERWERVIP